MRRNILLIECHTSESNGLYVGSTDPLTFNGGCGTKKLSKVAFLLLVNILMVSTVLSATLYTLTIPTSVKIAESYELRFETAASVVVTQYDWGSMKRGSSAVMVIDGGNGFNLKNLGDTAVQVVWTSTLPAGFTLTVKRFSSGSYIDWPMNTAISMPVDGSIELKPITLTLGASLIPGNTYAINLDFQVVG